MTSPSRRSIEVVFFDEMMEEGIVSNHDAANWIRFMVRVCRENPHMPEEFLKLVDLAEQNFFGTGVTDTDIAEARSLAWKYRNDTYGFGRQLEDKQRLPYVQDGENSRTYREGWTTADERDYATYYAVRGLICLLSPREKMNFKPIQGNFEETLFYFVDFMLSSTNVVLPDFQYRMTEILEECLYVMLEQNTKV